MNCTSCDKELSRSSKHRGKTLCGPCGRALKKTKHRNQIEGKLAKLDYNVLQWFNGNGGKIKVQCTNCGRVRNTYHRNLLIDNRKCTCKSKQKLHKQELAKNAPVDVVIETPIELYGISGVYKITIGDTFYIGSSVDVGTKLNTVMLK